jgi:Fe-S cluster assembly iron-binding protein IscA
MSVESSALMPPARHAYSEELMSSGFNLQNPNIKRSCGCGSSFVV